MSSVKYSENVLDKLHMLTNRRGDGNLASKRREAERDGEEVLTSFHQQARRIKCWKCNEYGHTKSQCPLLTDKRKKESEERLFVLSNGRQPGYSGLQLGQLANSAFLDG